MENLRDQTIVHWAFVHWCGNRESQGERAKGSIGLSGPD
jgi:hypothetical protein